MKTIKYSVFSVRGGKALADVCGGKVLVDGQCRYLESDWGAGEAVARSLARRTRTSVVTVRHDGWAKPAAGGNTHKPHYQITLGRPCPGGGWTPVVELMVCVDAVRSAED